MKKLLAALFCLWAAGAQAQTQFLGDNGEFQLVPAASISGTAVCATHQWLTSVIACAQPAVTDISGFGAGVSTALADAANVSGGFVTSPVANANLANTSVTVNGQTCTLGSTCTVTATAAAALTFGTHLAAGGTSYNGSAPVTITSDATAANTASTIMARDGSGQVAATTFTGALTGHASLDLALTGGTMSGNIAMGGNQINNAVIGASNPLAASFTSVGASGNITAAGAFMANGGTNSCYNFQNGSSTTIGSLCQAGASGLFTMATLAGGFGTLETWNYTTGANDVFGPLISHSDFITNSGSPTIASGACGTGTNGTITGDNQSGVITIGAVATTSCAVSFSATLSQAPKSCVAFPGNATAAGATILGHIDTISAIGFTLSGAVLASTKFNFHCY